MLPRHKSLAYSESDKLNLGYTLMAKDDAPLHTRDRTSRVSLFRRGKGREKTVADIDLQTGREIFTDPFPLALFNPVRVWDSLNVAVLEQAELARNGLFLNASESPAAAAFDILRTRVSQAMADRGWRRIGVTSPTHGCGKSFTAANLALALSRRPGSRTVLLDLDLRRPGLHRLFGLKPAGALRDFLDGSQPMESMFFRAGRGLALGLNADPVADAGDVLHAPETESALQALDTQLDPDVVVLDLPPALAGDDVIALAGKVDAVLIVADGTQTTAKEIRACERMFEGRIPLMGVVLNRAEERGLRQVRQGKG